VHAQPFLPLLSNALLERYILWQICYSSRNFHKSFPV
jgi:hypothetical protein